MDNHDILKVLAPCGLSCQKCFAFHEGNIRRHALGLQEALGSFDRYAARFVKLVNPVFENYPAFKGLLNHMTKANCSGCRKGECEYKNCGVIDCFRQKGVDFCFQCEDFPCDHSCFDSDLKQRWIAMNRRMKEIGIEQYFEETKDRPRYV